MPDDREMQQLAESIAIKARQLLDELTRQQGEFFSQWHHRGEEQKAQNTLKTIRELSSELKELAGAMQSSPERQNMSDSAQSFENDFALRVVDDKGRGKLVFESRPEERSTLMLKLNKLLHEIISAAHARVHEPRGKPSAQVILEVLRSPDIDLVAKSQIDISGVLSGDAITIGSANVAVQINDEAVSARHAEIRWAGAFCRLKALNSAKVQVSNFNGGKYGEYHSGQEFALQNWAAIQLGNTTLRLRISQQKPQQAGAANQGERMAIISDVHANLAALKAVLQDISRRGIERAGCCGDIVGYGPEPIECLNMLKQIPSVMGNHEHAIANNDLSRFNFLASASAKWTRRHLMEKEPSRLQDIGRLPVALQHSFRGINFAMFHGKPSELETPNCFLDYIHDRFDAEDAFRANPTLFKTTPVAIIGNTHEPAIFEYDIEKGEVRDLLKMRQTKAGVFPLKMQEKRYIINAGSVGQPRDHNPDACYCILSPDSVEIARVKYDIKETTKLIKELNVYGEQSWNDTACERLAEGR
jgi:predicted phosphodiesterase